MQATRYLIALVVAAVLATGVWAADKAAKLAAKQGLQGNESPLVPADALTKLKLDAGQQEKINKLIQEFADKNKESLAKIKEQVAKLSAEAVTAKQNNDKAALKKLKQDMQTLQEPATKLREEFEGKVVGLLNDEQKKTFEELKKDFPKPAVKKKPAK